MKHKERQNDRMLLGKFNHLEILVGNILSGDVEKINLIIRIPLETNGLKWYLQHRDLLCQVLDWLLQKLRKYRQCSRKQKHVLA